MTLANSGPNSGPNPALTQSRQITGSKLALVRRLRENFPLKAVALISSVLLYFYVQSERNPTVTKPFTAVIVKANAPLDVDVVTSLQQVDVRISGPQSIVNSIKDNDVRIIADLKSVPSDRSSSSLAPTQYHITGLAADRVQDLTFDPPHPPRLGVKSYPDKTVEMPIVAHAPTDAPAGYRYGRPEIRPTRVKVSGREDYVSRVSQIVASVASGKSGAAVDGDFPLFARDSNNNTIDGVVLVPPTIHVSIKLVVEPYSKIVSVSPDVKDQPQLPYRLSEITVLPRQVKIIGKPDLVDKIGTLTTEPIPVHDLIENKTMEAPLLIPDGLSVVDDAGKPIRSVTVQLSVGKAPPPPDQNPVPATAGPPPP